VSLWPSGGGADSAGWCASLAATPMTRNSRRPKKLWQAGLLWLDDAINLTVPHPLDDERMKKMMVGLRRVGDWPVEPELTRYMAELWPCTPWVQRAIRALWRKLERNPNHRFRWSGGDFDDPLYIVDVLSERHGMQSLEDRLSVVMRDAARAYHAASMEDDQQQYKAGRKTLESAIESVHSLRRLRLGPAALGEGAVPEPGEIVGRA
jgi:hypothetical protein